VLVLVDVLLVTGLATPGCPWRGIATVGQAFMLIGSFFVKECCLSSVGLRPVCVSCVRSATEPVFFVRRASRRRFFLSRLAAPADARP
jgi:hypothetical protein